MTNYFKKIHNLIYNEKTSVYSFMFYFNFSNETWRESDNNWGLFEEGDENSVGNFNLLMNSYENLVENVL